jgi:hypothetical protein
LDNESTWPAGCHSSPSAPACARGYSIFVCTIQTEHILNDLGSTLRFRSVTPDRIILPLLAALYRAPLGEVDFRRLSDRPHRDVQDRSGHSL